MTDFYIFKKNLIMEKYLKEREQCVNIFILYRLKMLFFYKTKLNF